MINPAEDLNQTWTIPGNIVAVLPAFHETDPWLYMPTAAEHALVLAQRAYVRGHSWRGKKVGAAAIGRVSIPEAGFSVMTAMVHGANYKPEPGDTPNLHAEDGVLKGAAEAGIGELLALAIVGEPQRDDVSGLDMPTLPPCAKRCTPALLASEHMNQNLTRVVSGTPDLTTVQVYGMTALALAHKTGNGSHIPTIHFDIALHVGEEQADLADDARARQIDSEWVNKFTVPLLDQVISQRGLFGRKPTNEQ